MTPMGADIGYAPAGWDMNGQSIRPSNENDFEAVPAEQPFRPAGSRRGRVCRDRRRPWWWGPEGEQIYTDALGRVKVRFHWDRGEQLARDGRKEADSSCWIRVSQGWAGGQYGTMFIPRIGQEVVVDFLEGDPDQPIIIGRVYNGDLMPPYPLPDEKTKSVIKTSSSKGGGGCNELRFEDKKGQEQIFLHAEKDLHIRVTNDRVENVEHDRHLTVDQNKTERVGKDKSVHVQGKQSHKVDKTLTITCGENRFLTVDRNDVELVRADKSVRVQDREARRVDGSLSVTCGGNVVEEFKSSHRHTVRQTYALRAAKRIGGDRPGTNSSGTHRSAGAHGADARRHRVESVAVRMVSSSRPNPC